MVARFASRNGLLDIYLSYIFMKGFLSRINRENSLFSFLSRVCSRSYHLRDDRQIFCHEFLRRYICVLCRVVPYSGEVREFLQQLSTNSSSELCCSTLTFSVNVPIALCMVYFLSKLICYDKICAY